MDYVIGTGYHVRNPDRLDHAPAKDAAWFWSIWDDNTWRYATPAPAAIYVLASGGFAPPTMMRDYDEIRWIQLEGDLGHTHDLSNGRKPYHWCGWSINFVTLALLAYNNECDFVFKEQDTLAFGPWLQRMKDEIGSAGMIFGKSPTFPAVQSLVYCKHDFIPEFVRLYMGTGSEKLKENEGELKFARLAEAHPDLFARYSFGCDRDRPIPFDAEVFYCQHITAPEMLILKAKGLV